jgi:hypothetical protein
MTNYAALPDPEAEQAIFTEMQRFDDDERLRYTRAGLMVQTVQKRMLWQRRLDPETNYPCRSFGRWLRICCPYSYATAYSALRDVDDLQDLPADELAQIPHANIPTMKQLSGGVRKRPEVLAAAKTQSNEEFVETIRQAFPHQHLEHKRALRFNPDESAAEKIEQALEMAKDHGASTRDDALELLAVTAVEQWQMEREVGNRVRSACDEVVE